MPLTMSFNDSELPDLDRLLNRALNCWEPKDQPPWALGLADRVKARLQKIDEFNRGDPAPQASIPEAG